MRNLAFCLSIALCTGSPPAWAAEAAPEPSEEAGEVADTTAEAKPSQLAAPPGSAVPATEADSALLRVLMRLFDPWSSPESRQAAFRDPALGDERAASPLVFLLRDPDVAVRESAARALSPFAKQAKIEEELAQVLQARREPLAVRIAAAHALSQGARSAADLLFRIQDDDDAPLPLRQAAGLALAEGFPELVRERAPVAVADRGGRTLLTIGSGFLGSYALATVGLMGKNDAGVAIGALGGVFLGGATAYLLTRSGEISRAQAGWMVSAGGWGVALGVMSSLSATRDPSVRTVFGIGLLGEALGLGAAFATRDWLPYSSGDVALMNWGGVLGFTLMGGTLLFFEGDDPRKAAGALLGATVLGLGAGAISAPHLSFSNGDALMTADSAYEGAMLGYLAARVLDVRARHAGGATLLGLGGGFMAGAALSQVRDMRPRDAIYIFAAGTYGKLFGMSIPLLLDSKGETVAAGTLAGSLLGLGAGHVTAGTLPFSETAVLFVGLATGFGYWHGYALGESLRGENNDRRRDGLLWLGTTLGGIAAAPLDLNLRLSKLDVAALAGGAFWGSWFAAWGAELANASRAERLQLTLAAGDLGLLLSAAAISRWVDIDPRRIGIANLAGLAGAGIGSLAAALATQNDDAVIVANIVGSGAGLAIGAFIAAHLELDRVPLSARQGGHSRTGSGPFGAAPPMLYPLILPANDGMGTGAPPALGLGLALFD